MKGPQKGDGVGFFKEPWNSLGPMIPMDQGT